MREGAEQAGKERLCELGRDERKRLQKGDDRIQRQEGGGAGSTCSYGSDPG